MTNLWKNEYQNWNAFYTPDIPHSLKIQMIFCCMRCDTRTELFNFWSFRCRKGSKNFIITYFQKLIWFYLLATKDRLLGKVWGKTLFRCEMPWTALTQTESITSRFKLEVLKRIFQSRNFIQTFSSRVYCTFNEPLRRKEHVCTKHKIKKFSLKAMQYDIMTVKLEI